MLKNAFPQPGGHSAPSAMLQQGAEPARPTFPVSPGYLLPGTTDHPCQRGSGWVPRGGGWSAGAMHAKKEIPCRRLGARGGARRGWRCLHAGEVRSVLSCIDGAASWYRQKNPCIPLSSGSACFRHLLKELAFQPPCRRAAIFFPILAGR